MVSSHCNREITAEGINEGHITTYEWKAFDPQTGEVLEDFFTGNTNSATVLPSLTHPFFATFGPNELVKVRIQLTIVDQNGFSGQKNQLISFRQPLRINLPDVINRCPGTIATIQNNPVAMGGSGFYGITWTQTNAQNSYNVLSCTNCLTPTVTANSAGTFTYTVELTDLSFGCIQEKNITVQVQAMSAFKEAENQKKIQTTGTVSGRQKPPRHITRIIFSLLWYKYQLNGLRERLDSNKLLFKVLH